MINTNGFGMCCGARVAYGFPANSAMQGYTMSEAEKTTFKRELDEMEALQTRQQIGMITAIINNYQYKHLWPFLKERGWRIVQSATNPVHQNQTTIFLLVKRLSPKARVIKKLP